MSDFIPKSYKKEQTTIRIDAEKMKKIDELANSFNLSRSEFINQSLTLRWNIWLRNPNRKINICRAIPRQRLRRCHPLL